jgi:hypothetical protein
MLLGMLVSVTLAGEPMAVVLARRTNVSAPEAAALTTRAAAALQLPGAVEPAEVLLRMGRLGLRDATSCKARDVCLAELGRQLQVGWLVLVSLSQLGEERSLGLELLQVAAEKVVDREAVLLPPRAGLDPALLEAFRGRVASRLATAADAPRLDPRLLSPGPGASSPLGSLAAAEAAPRSRTPALVMGGAGIALVVASVALLVVGLGTRAQLSQGELRNGQVYSPLTAQEAQGVATRASVELGGAAVGAAAALGLGLGAAVAW